MYRHDRRQAALHLLMNQRLGPLVEVEFSLDVIPKLPSIQIVRAFVDNDKHRTGNGLRDRLRGRDKRVGNGDYDVTLPYSRADQSESQSVGTTANSDAVLNLAELGEILLKSLNNGTADKAASVQNVTE